MSEEKPPRKKPGPKAVYPKYRATQDGAPLLATRVDPVAYEWAKSRPEGTRAFLERIILDDKARTTCPDDTAILGRGVPTENIMGFGPMGHRTQLERIKCSVESGEALSQELAVDYWDILLKGGHTAEEIKREIPLLARSLPPSHPL
jgi:hypothetical protein